MRATLYLVMLLALTLPVAVLAQEGDTHTITLNDAITFAPIEVPGFDSGMQIAALHGDPAAETGDYTIRLKFPAGYKFPVHWHPKGEHLTVLSGTFLLAMGGEADASAYQSYQPGTFIYIPGEHPHYGGAETETVIQLHGEGPFKILMAESGT